MKYWIALRVALRVGYAVYKEAAAHRSELEWIVKAAKSKVSEIVKNIKKELEK